jgi:DNA-binding PucR family transcriptional regulator
LRLARIAMVAAPVGSIGVTVFDSAPLAVTVMTAAEILPRVTASVLGPLLELPEDDQATLLDTLDAWSETGSAAAAADKMSCHENTIRYRLRRVEALTGRSLSSPRAVAELCLALEAVRLLPADRPEPVLDHSGTPRR